jgi:hypothetical protein
MAERNRQQPGQARIHPQSTTKQTNKQTNKQGNKQAKKQQSNKRTNKQIAAMATTRIDGGAVRRGAARRGAHAVTLRMNAAIRRPRGRAAAATAFARALSFPPARRDVSYRGGGGGLKA